MLVKMELIIMHTLISIVSLLMKAFLIMKCFTIRKIRPSKIKTYLTKSKIEIYLWALEILSSDLFLLDIFFKYNIYKQYLLKSTF